MRLHEILLQHNVWATRALLEVCRSLTAEQFHQRFDIGPGNLHDTLRHIVGAMIRWADRIAQREVRPSIEDAKPRHSIEQMIDLLERADRELGEVMQDVARQNRFDEKIMPQMRGWKDPKPFTKAAAFTHIMTHGAHHRAQAVNMLRRLGVKDLPELDAIEWELQSAAP